MESPLASFARLTNEHSNRRPSAPSHLIEPMAAALNRTFEDNATTAACTIINALSHDDILPSPHHLTANSLVVGLENTATAPCAQNAEQYGAIALLSLLAKNYRPHADSSSEKWQRRKDALATAARQAIAHIPDDNQFYELAQAVNEQCIELGKTPEEATYDLAFELMDLPVLHAETLPQENNEEIPEAVQPPGAHTQQREALSLNETQTRALQERLANVSWLPETIDVTALPVTEVYDGTTRIASVIDLIPFNKRLRDIRKKSEVDPIVVEAHICSGIISSLSKVASPTVKGVQDCNIAMLCKRTRGPSERVLRIYLARLGSDGDVPLFGLAGVSRTKNLQAQLLTVLQNKRIRQHDIKG